MAVNVDESCMRKRLHLLTLREKNAKFFASRLAPRISHHNKWKLSHVITLSENRDQEFGFACIYSILEFCLSSVSCAVRRSPMFPLNLHSNAIHSNNNNSWLLFFINIQCDINICIWGINPIFSIQHSVVMPIWNRIDKQTQKIDDSGRGKKENATKAILFRSSMRMMTIVWVGEWLLASCS